MDFADVQKEKACRPVSIAGLREGGWWGQGLHGLGLGVSFLDGVVHEAFAFRQRIGQVLEEGVSAQPSRKHSHGIGSFGPMLP